MAAITPEYDLGVFVAYNFLPCCERKGFMYLPSYLEGRNQSNKRLHRNGTWQARKSNRLARPSEKPVSRPTTRGPISDLSKIVEPAETKIVLSEMPLGGRLLVRSRADWRVAAVCRIEPEIVVISVASPGGRNYRIRRDPKTILVSDGMIPVLTIPNSDPWRSNFSSYDVRW